MLSFAVRSRLPRYVSISSAAPGVVAYAVLRRSVLGISLPSLLVAVGLFPAKLGLADGVSTQLLALLQLVTSLASSAPAPIAPTADAKAESKEAKSETKDANGKENKDAEPPVLPNVDDIDGIINPGPATFQQAVGPVSVGTIEQNRDEMPQVGFRVPCACVAHIRCFCRA